MVSIKPAKQRNGTKWVVVHTEPRFKALGYLSTITFGDEETARRYVASLPKPKRRKPSSNVIEELEFMLDMGQRITDTAAALKLKPTSVERACYRAGRVDLIARDRNMGRG
ncbi:hypothetical protein [Microbacterium binotii]|uniref:hypothetical protein n=1 Tax=Microbacterium binotii TaxID=462710 RepID=UPI001F37804F|nr:hypothetical protein [Microbacterium binotii]UIN31897.1 hypothetical protein LXM64_06840 [Microbacterium binotii]